MGRSPRTRYRPGAAKRLVAWGTGAFGLALALWWPLRHFRRVAVVGASMEPALQAGDRLVLRRAASVSAGDIVAARDPRPPGRIVLKRIGSVGSQGLWLVGDNAAESTDSRHFGPVPEDALEGKAIYRYAPPARAGRLGPAAPKPPGRRAGRSAGSARSADR
ncbi:MAG: nickel-type superoxide dismutase maturation protease [Acidimicrobiales bacterium]